MFAASKKMSIPQRVGISALITALVMGGGWLVHREHKADDLNKANTNEDMCWNIPGWQPSIPAGRVLVGSAAESTVAIATPEEMAKSSEKIRNELIFLSSTDCITPADLRANLNRANAEGRQRAINQIAAEKQAGVALGRYIVAKRPATWQDQLDAVLTFYCTYDYDDGAFAPASAYYRKYWQASASRPLPQDFGQAVDRFCPGKFGHGY